MNNLVSRDVKSMNITIRWLYLGDMKENESKKVMTFVTLDCITRNVKKIIEADSCYDDIVYAYWTNAAGIKIYVKNLLNTLTR